MFLSISKVTRKLILGLDGIQADGVWVPEPRDTPARHCEGGMGSPSLSPAYPTPPHCPRGPQSLLTTGPRWFNRVSEEEMRSVVFCSQEWPWPLSQSTPQASWGSQGSRLSAELWPFTPILPCRAHLQPQPGPPGSSRASQTGQWREGPCTQRRPQHSSGEKLIIDG